MIVITAPTGNIGHQVLDKVLAADAEVRVVARDPGRLPDAVRARAEVVAGSHGDADVARRALDGAEALFLLVPADPRAAGPHAAYVEFARPIADALRDSGTKRVVSVTSIGRGTAAAAHAGHITASLAMDDLIASTGVAHRPLAAATFMDNVARQAQPIREQHTLYGLNAPDLRMPTVATRDIAAVAAGLLLDGDWAGQQEVPLLGPEHLSFDEMAAIASEVLGFEVRYQQIPGAALRDQLLGRGASAGMADSTVEMLLAADAGVNDGVPRQPRHAEQTPTTFRAWSEYALRPAVLGA